MSTTNQKTNEFQSANLEIAQTILQQLGGRRFTLMTGARNFLAVERGLSFSLPGTPNFVKDGINRVTVKLTGEDLYDVEYARSRGTTYRPVHKDEGIYFDQLQPMFTRATGLDTRL